MSLSLTQNHEKEKKILCGDRRTSHVLRGGRAHEGSPNPKPMKLSWQDQSNAFSPYPDPRSGPGRSWVQVHQEEAQPNGVSGGKTTGLITLQLCPHACRKELNGRLTWKWRLTPLYVWTCATETGGIIAERSLRAASRQRKRNKKRRTSSSHDEFTQLL